ncbi:MAG: winged helix-turn-helix transcriptional regulator [bacterium]|nr:MAG: winged helix-turn-helix transcriptional regulator [bacterium]
MYLRNKERYGQWSQVFKALAHPARLYMVEELSSGERCVCELTAMLDLDTSTVSKHLSVLRNAGVVADEKRGLMVYYSLRMSCVAGFLSCVRKALEDQARMQLSSLA